MADLDATERKTAYRHFSDIVFPALTPQAVTEAPGFPQPNLPSQALAFAVLVKDPQTGPLHLTFVRIPAMLERLIPIRDGRSFILLEHLIREHIDELFPGRSVLQAHLFRTTRSGELDAEEVVAGDLLQSVEEDAKRRGSNAVVRVEVEREMPESLRTLLLNELRYDTGGEPLPLGQDEIHEIGTPLDLTMLKGLASLPLPALRFPPMQPRAPFASDTTICAAIRERDHLVHHPYDDFALSVQRFIEEAADDPLVTAIKVTLYRAGERSPIVDALMRAAESGKDVSAFVELKARFDEARNVVWARRLGEAGVHVVYGLVGLKNHAKMSLVVRREGGALRRYVHVGTGNYNAGTARFYTDVGLFTADESLAADVNDLFNELTGSSRWPRGTYRKLLVAPHALLPGLLTRVQREIDHARAGRAARIRLKLNGLSDAELIDGLYRASQEGVAVDLIVRGLCRLRPGVPGMSERIRVYSILGRFLEHARIYEFENGGEKECFIGSADWRTRNVRRRVEVAAPVGDAACRAYLEAMLDREMSDESAWQLMPDGSYRRRAASPRPLSVAQNYFSAIPSMPASADLARA
jgi:polyphosphate kinase